LLLASVQEAVGLTGHVQDVSLPHAAYDALYRAARSRSVYRTEAVR